MSGCFFDNLANKDADSAESLAAFIDRFIAFANWGILLELTGWGLKKSHYSSNCLTIGYTDDSPYIIFPLDFSSNLLHDLTLYYCWTKF